MTQHDVLDEFVEGLRTVSRLGREVEKIERTVTKSEARILAKILAKLVPLMPYIDGPVPVAEGLTLPAKDSKGQTPCYREPGITLVNTFASSLKPGESGADFTGYKIVFTRSGNLVKLARRGWQDAGYGTYWSSEAETIKITPDFASRHLKEALTSVIAAVQRGTQRAVDQKDQLARRLDTLQRVDALLAEDEGA